jgi:hypothetical protein
MYRLKIKQDIDTVSKFSIKHLSVAMGKM